MKKLVLKNYHLTSVFEKNRLPVFSLQDWLGKAMLHGRESRMRTRFIKLLDPRIIEINKEREKIYTENSHKDKKGQTIFIDKDDKEVPKGTKDCRYKVKDAEKIAKELTEYYMEELIIDITPATEDIIKATRDIVLQSKDTFAGIMAVRYNEWCEALEKPFENDKKNKKDKKKQNEKK